MSHSSPISEKYTSSGNETHSSHKIDTPPSTSIHTPLKPEELHTSTKSISPSSPTPSSSTKDEPFLQSLGQDCLPDSYTRASGFTSKGQKTQLTL